MGSAEAERDRWRSRSGKEERREEIQTLCAWERRKAPGEETIEEEGGKEKRKNRRGGLGVPRGVRRRRMESGDDGAE